MIYASTARRLSLAAAVAAATAMLASGPAAAEGLDMSGIVSAVDASTILTALAAIAAIKVLPGVAKWAYNKVIGWFR